jgi:AcrR family transcriptional regulator
MVQLASVSRQLEGREAEGPQDQPLKHVVGRRTIILTKDRPIRKGRRPPGPMSPSDKQAILSYLKDLAGQLGSESLSTRQVKAAGHISPATIYRAFGGFSEALRQAGLRPSRTYKRNRETMLMELAGLSNSLGRAPSKTEIKENLSVNARHYEKEFGSVAKALALAREEHVNDGEPLPDQVVPAVQVRLTESKTRRKYGPTIGFHGLRHAPTNELGVVFLFGMLAEELGLVVEGIQSGFPDCDAKLKRPDGSYEGVRIEFEYKSKSFERDGHNSNECDLIVCWLHDWANCPLQVIELSSLVQGR